MIENRAEKTKTNCAPCLFYTQYLSGAAEREANFVLREAMLLNALEDGRRFQTIWVCTPNANAPIVSILTLHRTCMMKNTIRMITYWTKLQE
jgi:hypothetical protein